MTDSSAAAIMARVGAHPEQQPLRTVLRQVDGTYPRATLDALADSLANRAISNRETALNSPGYARAVNALSALGTAGVAGDIPGRALDGTLDRLIRVHREAPVLLIRSRALAVLPSVPDRARALAYLREVAGSSDATAVAAFNALLLDSQGGSLVGRQPTPEEQRASTAILRDLAEGQRAANPTVVGNLRMWRESHPRVP